ncbi:MAG TPA: PRC-barrel domain-containing protein [Candidatus Elarobacter sp.]|jgi:hypothetical protein
MKRRFSLVVLAAFALTAGITISPRALPAATPTPAPAAGIVPLGVTVIEMREVVVGWSVKKDLLGKSVQNDKKEDLGKIEDVIVSPSNSLSFAIIGVGLFLGIPSRLVAIPMKQLKLEGGQLVLPGATKDAVGKMPPFIYSH